MCVHAPVHFCLALGYFRVHYFCLPVHGYASPLTNAGYGFTFPAHACSLGWVGQARGMSLEIWGVTGEACLLFISEDGGDGQ